LLEFGCYAEKNGLSELDGHAGLPPDFGSTDIFSVSTKLADLPSVSFVSSGKSRPDR
jgi:hypothetical protein